jgi:NADPH:quinone reductase-like Zn-dependent oxidoreductase
METSLRQDPVTYSNGAAASRAVPRAGATMRAMVHDAYGSPDLLELREIARPTLGDGDDDDGVLVRVRAAGLHIGDCFGVRGSPLLMRMMTGLFKPKRGVPGFDVAGQVEAVGKNVKRFQPGDEVFGACDGACAEVAKTGASRLALKPANLSFEEAAALPTSGVAALRGLRDAGKIQAGQKVLINGASGGVGTFAVQIARSFGAEVTGVCSAANVDLVRSIGADHVLDYTREDFTQLGPRFDLILDNIENRALSECRRALTPSGTLVLNSGTGASGLAMMVRLFAPLLLSPFVRQNLRRYLAMANHEDLVVLKELVESGKLKPVVERTYALGEAAEALHHIEGGHARGKVVITL